MDVLTFNEALNVIASERSRVNLLSFTIRRHGSPYDCLSRNQSTGGLHLISSYVTPCKQRIQSCDAKITFPRVQNWKISPSPREVDTTSSKGNGEKRSRRTLLLPCFHEGILNHRRTKPFLSFSLSRRSYLALSSSLDASRSPSFRQR